MKYFDAFSGYGGFSLGIQRAYESKVSLRNGQTKDRKSKKVQSSMESSTEGLLPNRNITDTELRRDTGEVSCIGYSEIDRYAIETYSKHFPEHKNYGDITKINAEELPDFDLFVGGFPCQAFSIAGKRKGFDDTRGTLFFDIARILRAKRPRLLLLENVKGLLSHDNGKTFSTIITSLAELGYAVEWQVLNAKNFGVPQNRERVFIIGHLGGFSGLQIFPIGANDTISDSAGKSDPRRPQATICGTLKRSGAVKADDTFVKVREATKQGYAVAEPGDSINIAVPTSKTRRGRVGHKIAQTLDTGMQQYTICRPVLTPDRLKKRQNGRRFKEDGEPSFTLTGQDKHGIYDGVKIRRLTPTECERLMGLPDGWTKGVSDTQRYKLCGNGVVVNVVEEIVKRIL